MATKWKTVRVRRESLDRARHNAKALPTSTPGQPIVL